MKKEQKTIRLILVPRGSEQSFSFTHPLSIQGLLKRIDADRLVFVYRHSNISEKDARKDVSSIQSFFLPIGQSQVGTNFPVEKSRSRIELATVSLSSGVAVVEEVAFSYQPTHRILSFAPSLEGQSMVTIDTEFDAKPGTGVIDFKNTKLLPQHEAMMGVMKTYPPKTDSPSILVVGLGGGVIPSVVKAYFPLAKITVVEIEPALEQVSNE